MAEQHCSLLFQLCSQKNNVVQYCFNDVVQHWSSNNGCSRLLKQNKAILIEQACSLLLSWLNNLFDNIVHKVQYNIVHRVQHNIVHKVQYNIVHRVQHNIVHRVQYEGWLRSKFDFKLCLEETQLCYAILTSFSSWLLWCVYTRVHHREPTRELGRVTSCSKYSYYIGVWCVTFSWLYFLSNTGLSNIRSIVQNW